MTVKQEIQDLQLFGYALREENRKLFDQMMSDLDSKVLECAGLAKDPFEVIAMAHILRQRKLRNIAALARI